MPVGHSHWPAEFLKPPSRQGLAATGGGVGGTGGAAEGGVTVAAGAGSAGGAVLAGLATHRPFRSSCHGKHLLSVAVFDCECAADQKERVKQIKIAVEAKMRVIQKPRRHLKIGLQAHIAC
jgi:hypothetical protein